MKHPAPTPSLSSLARDRRGAALTIGVFFAPFLIGAIYYMVGCATVLTHREGFQQAADAAVFSPAVASARAMNAIAVMNNLMLCIMSIMIPVRALQPSYVYSTAVAASRCKWYRPCECLRAINGAQAIIKLNSKASKAEQRAKQLLQALSDAQDTLAVMGPQAGRLAAGESAKRTSAFLSGATPEVYSSSLVPNGCRKGLPVDDDHFSNVCERTKPFLWEITLRIANDLNTIGSCKSGGRALQYASAFELPNPTKGSLCKENANAPCSGSGPHPKKVVDGAKNGSDHMAWWVKVQGKDFDFSKKGVEIATKSKTGAASKADMTVGFAQSEIYYDCNGAWTSGGCNGSGSTNDAMWDTKWTARLRRVHMPDNAFAGDTEVRMRLANAAYWQGVRGPLLNARRDFTTGGPAGTEAASLVLNSSEGPLQ